MTTDEKVELARQLAERLGALRRTEWERWAQYAARQGLDKAIQLARSMASSPALRPDPQRAARTIAAAMQEWRSHLAPLSREDLTEVLGYTSRFLVWFAESRGSRHEESPPRHAGGIPSRRHRSH
jgi:hypothetical protein